MKDKERASRELIENEMAIKVSANAVALLLASVGESENSGKHSLLSALILLDFIREATSDEFLIGFLQGVIGDIESGSSFYRGVS